MISHYINNKLIYYGTKINLGGSLEEENDGTLQQES